MSLPLFKWPLYGFPVLKFNFKINTWVKSTLNITGVLYNRKGKNLFNSETFFLLFSKFGKNSKSHLLSSETKDSCHFIPNYFVLGPKVSYIIGTFCWKKNVLLFSFRVCFLRSRKLWRNTLRDQIFDTQRSFYERAAR